MLVQIPAKDESQSCPKNLQLYEFQPKRKESTPEKLPANEAKNEAKSTFRGTEMRGQILPKKDTPEHTSPIFQENALSLVVYPQRDYQQQQQKNWFSSDKSWK